MATLKLTDQIKWIDNTVVTQNKTNKLAILLRWADAQTEYKTIWFMVSLIVQGVLFLPIPAVLIYYFNAPLAVLGVTMLLFFANVIAGMGGSGIRVLIALSIGSIFIHLLMLAIFIL